MKTYTLDQAGVTAWQTDLYGSSTSQQQMERLFIHEDFEGWLVDRFGVTQRQLDFIATLPEDFVALLRDELALSLQAHLVIQLDRQPQQQNLHVRSGDAVKVVEFQKWLDRQKEGEEEPEEPEEPENPQGNPNQDQTGKPERSGSERLGKEKESYFRVKTYYRGP